jgi:hypothetical protein
MKPFLMKGKLRCVGCSTVEDFRMYIEKDGALARQFSPVRSANWIYKPIHVAHHAPLEDIPL